MANFTVVFIVSYLTQDNEDRVRRMEYHSYLREYAGLPEHKKQWIPLVLIMTIIWFIFAIGPGAVVGNWFFGNPNDPSTWALSIPPIWTWQILWWLLGVYMMWILAFQMEMSTLSDDKINEILNHTSNAKSIAK